MTRPVSIRSGRLPRGLAIIACAVLLVGAWAPGRSDEGGKRREVADLIGQSRAEAATVDRRAGHPGRPGSTSKTGDPGRGVLASVIQDGLTWLEAAQNPTGSWGAVQELIETGTAVEAIATIEPVSGALTDGSSWLAGESAANHEFLARQILALSSASGFEQMTEDLVGELIAVRNATVFDSGLPNWPEGGWGVGPGFESDCLTTGLAVSALERTGSDGPGVISQAVTYLTEAQNPDGGWGLQRGQPSELYTTLHVLLGLLDHGEPAVQDEIDDGIAYLHSLQLGDGSFGFGGPSIAYVTALAALNLVRADSFPFGSETEEAVAALLAMQDIDGSWSQEPYDTALSLVAYWEHNQAPSVAAGDDQVIADLDGSGFENVLLSGVADDADGTIQDYAWSEGGVVLANGPSVMLSLNVSQHLIVLTVTDDKGKPASDSVLVTIVGPGPDTDGDGLSDNVEGAITLTDPAEFDTDGDGVPDGLEDFDFDGRSNAQEILDRTSVFDPDVFLRNGLNLFAYPVEVPDGLTAVTFLAQVAAEAEVVSIGRLDAATQSIETVPAAGGARGLDFPIAADEGYLLTMAADAHLVFTGRPNCPTHMLEPGVNLIGVPCAPPGLTQDELLFYLGDDSQIAGDTVLDLETGRFRAAVRSDDDIAGERERVHAGRGILVYMKLATGPIPPPLAPPVVEITSPAGGTTSAVTPITVIGNVDDPLATVSVNGIAASVDGGGVFTATGVPLVQGPNDIEAVANGTNNLVGATSIVVTFDPPPVADYTLNRPDSVMDSRSFNVGPGTLNTVASFLLEGVDIPFGLTYSPGGVGFNAGTGDVTTPFTISTSADATVGIQEFQIIYIFRDAAAVELARHTLDFTVQILP